MALPNKPESSRTLLLDSKYPESLPRLPEDIAARFPSFAARWQSQMDTWWNSVRTSLVRDLQMISDSHNEQVAALEARITKLES